MDLHETIADEAIELEKVCSELSFTANAFRATGNKKMTKILLTNVDIIKRSISILSTADRKEQTRLFNLAEQSSKNVVNAALAGIQMGDES